MNRRGLILGSVAGLVLSTVSAFAAEWVRLGERTVNLLAEFDIVPVGVGDGLYSHVRLEVSGSDVFVRNVSVVFGNGSRAELPVRSQIRKGTRTRDIALPGGVRGIRRVEMFYSRAANGGKARVVIWGRRV